MKDRIKVKYWEAYGSKKALGYVLAIPAGDKLRITPRQYRRVCKKMTMSGTWPEFERFVYLQVNPYVDQELAWH